MKILGIDPGNSMGYNLYDNETNTDLSNGTKKMVVNNNQTMELFRKIKNLIKEMSPDIVIVENSKNFSTRHLSFMKMSQEVKQSIIVKQAIGLTRSISFVVAACESINIPCYGLSQTMTSTLRKKHFPNLIKSDSNDAIIISRSKDLREDSVAPLFPLKKQDKFFNI